MKAEGKGGRLSRKLKMFQEDKGRLSDVGLFDEWYFFEDKSAASRKTLTGIVIVNRLNHCSQFESKIMFSGFFKSTVLFHIYSKKERL